MENWEFKEKTLNHQKSSTNGTEQRFSHLVISTLISSLRFVYFDADTKTKPLTLPPESDTGSVRMEQQSDKTRYYTYSETDLIDLRSTSRQVNLNPATIKHVSNKTQPNTP